MSSFHTIHLHGALGRQYGKSYRLSVETPAEAVYALTCQLPGFATSCRDGAFRCIIGPRKGGHALAESELRSPFLAADQDFHLVPVIAGRGNKGGAKIIVGVALIALAIALPMAAPETFAALSGAVGGIGVTTTMGVTYMSTLAMVGVMTALGGVAMTLSPQAKGQTPAQAAANTQNSFTFNGTDNVTQQGGPVPLLYGGPLLVGSTTIEEGLAVYNYPVGDPGSPTDLNIFASYAG